MILVVVKALPTGSNPPAAVGERISKGSETRLGRRSAVLDQDDIPARENGRFGFHAETSRAHRVGIDPVC